MAAGCTYRDVERIDLDPDTRFGWAAHIVDRITVSGENTPELLLGRLEPPDECGGPGKYGDSDGHGTGREGRGLQAVFPRLGVPAFVTNHMVPSILTAVWLLFAPGALLLFGLS